MNASASAASPSSALAPAPTVGTTSSQWRVALSLLAAVGAAACLIIMGEIDRLIASSVGTSGQSRPFSTYIGITGFSASDSWGIWDSVARNFPLGSWITLSLEVDFAFILCYSNLLFRIAGGYSRASKLAKRSIWALIILDITENIVLLSLANNKFFVIGPPWWPWIFCGLKWLAAVLVLLVLVRSSSTTGPIATFLTRAGHSLYTHRIALIVVVILGALSLLPLGNIFDQLPDVQRQWLDDREVGILHGYSAVITAVLLALGFFILGRLRSLLEWNKYVHDVPPTQPARVWLWAIAIAAVLSGFVVTGLITKSWAVDALWYIILPAIVLITFALERFFPKKMHEYETARDAEVLKERECISIESKRARLRNEEDRYRVRAQFTETTGDVISVLVICISCLGLVRAFTAPVVLFATGYPLPGDPFGPWAWFLVGLIGALLSASPLMRWVSGIPGGASAAASSGSQDIDLGASVQSPDSDSIDAEERFPAEPRSTTPVGGNGTFQNPDSVGADHTGAEALTSTSDVVEGSETSSSEAGGTSKKARRPTRETAISIVCIVVSFLVLVGTAVFPFQVAERLGAAAMTIVALGAWSLFLGTIQVALQQHRPPFIFYVARFRAVPLLTLLFVVPFVINLDGGVAAVHAIRSSGDPPTPGTPTLGTKTLADSLIDPAWDSWGPPSKTGCDKSLEIEASSAANPAGVQRHIRPVILVAAQGGGIRAAYWTGRTMEAISRSAACISESVLLASGVSGSSVGLVVASLSRGPNKEATTESLNRLSDSKTLATAMAGYLAGDGIAAVSGVRVPTLEDGKWSWHDRAALIEMAWERREESLKSTFSPTPSKSTGALVLNSTDSVSGCRVILAQQDSLAAPRSEQATKNEAGEPGDLECDAADMGTAAAISFQHLTGSTRCMASLHWSTIAMLSARFPFVTPAGRLPEGQGGCSSPYKAQLVDGGYADNTGLATLFDLVPEIRERVLRANSKADGTKEKPFVFPVLMYVENSLGSDIDEKGKMSAEFLMPLRDKDVKEKQVAADAWIQRIATGLEDVCPSDIEYCDDTHTKFQETIPAGVVVVSPATRPAIAPPLGWTLSGLSRANLCKALEMEITATGTPASFGRLGNLFSLTEDPPPTKCPG
ncbi:hypothetical protein [Arthrobacter sp. Cr_A7]|uniref:hypothetical protein n=1 Tax=Arthrobacter sp. Cr_A7 TaxID=3031017 RepID=UPI0023DB7187|nr:hypothetical protein [Arthrobacter sp. Cr_A7]MDF2048881.1 hypothetical protein [Arthrobacter sp. Cr_A7]